jgi:aspartyl-tRNA(Asn)/glutamyl-tRNA(Gln) amidotransferase subunit A
VSLKTFRAALILGSNQDVISQFDDKDPTLASPEKRDQARGLATERISQLGTSSSKPLAGLKVGIPHVSLVDNAKTMHELIDLAGILSHRGATIAWALIWFLCHSHRLRTLSAHTMLFPARRQAATLPDTMESAMVCDPAAKHMLPLTSTYLIGTRAPAEPLDDTSRTSRVYAKSRTVGLGEEVQKRILLGTYALTAE